MSNENSYNVSHEQLMELMGAPNTDVSRLVEVSPIGSIVINQSATQRRCMDILENILNFKRELLKVTRGESDGTIAEAFSMLDAIEMKFNPLVENSELWGDARTGLTMHYGKPQELAVLRKILEFKESILAELTKGVIDIDTYVKMVNNNVAAIEDELKFVPDRLGKEGSLELRLINSIRGGLECDKKSLAVILDKLISVTNSFIKNAHTGVNPTEEQIKPLDLANLAYEVYCIVDPDDYKEANTPISPARVEMFSKHLASISERLDPTTPLIPEHTTEDVHNDFCPKKVDNADIHQALLDIHEELKGIRKALETK